MADASGAAWAARAREAAASGRLRGQAMGGRPSKRAGRCRAGHRPVSTCRRRDRLNAPRAPLRWEAACTGLDGWLKIWGRPHCRSTRITGPASRPVSLLINVPPLQKALRQLDDYGETRQ